MPASDGSPEHAAVKRNVELISALLNELDVLGVREFCVAAGARNAQLLHLLLVRGSVVYHFVEERSAAFFALGRVMHSRRPVAVVTTSGTAVAELFPAMMEAHYQALPLIAVTADRPSRYRGSGAPQAVEQMGFFSSYVVRDVEMEYRGEEYHATVGQFRPGVGPQHFNICLEEGFACFEAEHKNPPVRKPLQHPALEWDKEGPGRIWSAKGPMLALVGGLHPADVPAAREFLLKVGVPVMAEATSNLLGDESLKSQLLAGGESTLRAFDAKRVVRLGSVPSWRWWRDLDGRADIPVLNISRALFRGLARTEGVVTCPWDVLRHPDFPVPVVASAMPVIAEPDRLEQLLTTHPLSEPAWMGHLSRAMSEGSMVMLGNSLPIREWNLAGDAPPVGAAFFANRGANGIDGLVSTWLGLSAQSQESWLILGDLSAIYDLGAPWILPQLKSSKRRLVVIN
ncbi:MAG TPA: 2-succinyl-5-enolpyruvyl-6-hydroxy-3-cyclohexene-1-carboxylic-acid synthase, partial [Candidatus Saccharimonadia bacterium]|nr:2-succinyl-5-enolpyruvyl-6-hydroxy-3-cyclohexene-1-carboxylic-acid synthase [Candidatus Saccharimonadia bacterium]